MWRRINDSKISFEYRYTHNKIRNDIEGDIIGPILENQKLSDTTHKVSRWVIMLQRFKGALYKVIIKRSLSSAAVLQKIGYLRSTVLI